MRDFLFLFCVFILFLAGTVVLSPLFRFNENLWLFAFLLFMLTRRPLDQSLLLGTAAAALVAELFLGVPAGSVAGPVLLLALGLAAVSKAVNLFPFHDPRSPSPVKILGPAALCTVLFAVLSGLSVLVSGLFSGVPAHWESLLFMSSPVFVLSQIGGVVLVLAVADRLLARMDERRRFLI